MKTEWHPYQIVVKMGWPDNKDDKGVFKGKAYSFFLLDFETLCSNSDHSRVRGNSRYPSYTLTMIPVTRSVMHTRMWTTDAQFGKDHNAH